MEERWVWMERGSEEDVKRRLRVERAKMTRRLEGDVCAEMSGSDHRIDGFCRWCPTA